MESIYFNFFSIGLILSSAMLVVAKNPVHSILYLILAFVNGTILFLLLRVEFLAILFLIVYIGAVAILFLFVVMMLNIKLVEFNESFVRFVPISFLLGLVFLYYFYIVVGMYVAKYSDISFSYLNWEELVYSFANIEILGQCLFTNFWLLFLVSSLVLLVAMVGAIVLSLSKDQFVKKQDLYYQISSDVSNSVTLVS